MTFHLCKPLHTEKIWGKRLYTPQKHRNFVQKNRKQWDLLPSETNQPKKKGCKKVDNNWNSFLEDKEDSFFEEKGFYE